jgi:hypothetical protein
MTAYRCLPLVFACWCLAPLTLGACKEDTSPGSSQERAHQRKRDASAGEKPLWLVVTRPLFEKALAPLAALRRSQGLEVVISTESVRRALAHHQQPRPSFLLLVGDWEAGERANPWSVPTRRHALYRWRAPQRKTYAADALWGDLNGDGRPDVPVGRLPARSVEELSRAVAKIIAYERQPPSRATLRATFWAGAPGYNALIDSLATNALIGVVRAESPPWLEPWMISGDAKHALCGPPGGQVARFNARLRQPGLVAALVGHGREHLFHSMRYQGRSIDYRVRHTRPLDAPPSPRSRGARGPVPAGAPRHTPGGPQRGSRAASATATAPQVAPPTVLLTCSSGRFDFAGTSLSEALLWRRRGPVAVIGATTESHPLTNFYTGLELLRALGRSEPRLGRIWLDAQRRAFRGDNALVNQALLGAEGKLTPTLDLAKLRLDQERMYALLGDPATRLPLPRPLKVDVRQQDATVTWRVERPEEAHTLYVDHRPAGRPFPRPAGPRDAAGAARAFDEANRLFRFAPLRSLSSAKPWSGTLHSVGAGTLRFITLGPTALYVFTHEVEPDND